jgi:hypothetical protein
MSVIYDKKTKRFRDNKGRFISPKVIRNEIDKVVQVTAGRLEKIATDLTLGKIDIKTFQTRTRDVLKSSYTLSGSVAKGGWRQMTKGDWGKVGAQAKREYGYLNKFAEAIKSGKLSDKQIIARARSYASSVRAVYEQSSFDNRKEAGGLCRRVLNAKESCSECRAAASRGFIEVDEMPPVGSLLCKSFCRCRIEFK